MKLLQKMAGVLLAAGMAVLPCVQLPDTMFEVKALTAEEEAIRNAEIVICAVNDIRVQNGLREMPTIPLLMDCADVRAKELSELFDHMRPDGTTCFTLLKKSGLRYSVSAENIAYGRADSVSTVNQWMNSQGHRDNILNPDFTHIGVGYYFDPDSPLVYHWSMYLVASYEGDIPYIFDDQYFPERVLGDVNGTKTINASDAGAILQYAAEDAAGLECAVTHDFADAADVNGDGKINSLDASVILIYSAARGSGKNVTLQDCIW